MKKILFLSLILGTFAVKAEEGRAPETRFLPVACYVSPEMEKSENAKEMAQMTRIRINLEATGLQSNGDNVDGELVFTDATYKSFQVESVEENYTVVTLINGVNTKGETIAQKTVYCRKGR